MVDFAVLGDQQVHINVDLDALPFLGQYATSGATPSPEMTEDGGRIFDDPSRDDSLQFIQNNLVTTAGILLVETNDEAALCDIHTALCPLVCWRQTENGTILKIYCTTYDWFELTNEICNSRLITRLSTLTSGQCYLST